MKKISTYQKFTEELKNPRFPYKESTKDLVRNHLINLKFYKYNLVNFYQGEVDKLLSMLKSNDRDVNDEYQLPLSLLYSTGKFNIKKEGDKYILDSLKNKSVVLDKDGNWSFVNKLNTNYSDLLDLIVDFICQSGQVKNVLNAKTFEELKKYLIDDKLKYFQSDFLKYFDIQDLFNYTKNSMSNTEIGEETESNVIHLLNASGIETVYQGGNGDFVDMLLGVDLIGKDKSGKIWTFQVKSKRWQLEQAIQKNRYPKVDALICPHPKGFELYTGGKFFILNNKGFTVPYPGKTLINVLRNPDSI